jgi:hypothetical protein
MIATDIVVNMGHDIGSFFWCSMVPEQKLKGVKKYGKRKKRNISIISVRKMATLWMYGVCAPAEIRTKNLSLPTGMLYHLAISSVRCHARW